MAPSAGGVGAAWIPVAAAGSGFACMAAELTAVRLLAPHFGDSSYVWTNVLGVILAALAVGALFGGRLASGPEPRRSAGRVLAAAGLLLAATPHLVGWLGPWLLPQELPLDAAMPALVRGSMVATVLVFAPPMLLLGAVSPLLVAAATRSGREVGRAAGVVGAAGTIGSLLGTFLATHWLVPTFGCRLSMWGAGGALLALAGWLLLPSRRANGGARAVAGLVAIGAFGLCGWHGGPLRAPAAGRTLLAEVESKTQFLQVQREPRSDGERTVLVINEGLDSFHSVAIAGSSLTGRAYYDWHALAPLLAGDGERPQGLSALSLGDAAGSLRAVYAAVHPGATVDAVDVDAATMALGDTWFPGPKASGERAAVDARVFLQRSPKRWHVIHVDAYAHQVYVPAHLASREFFQACRERLLPGGVVALNVGALRSDDPVLQAIGATLARVFDAVLALPVPNSRNVLLVGRLGGAVAPERLRAEATADARLADADLASWRSLVAHAADRRQWRSGFQGIELVDDRPALDELLVDSYLAGRSDGAEIVCRGPRDVAAAELAAYEARQARDWTQVLQAVEQANAPSAYLRELAGDARWALRQLRSAATEYRAAAALAVEQGKRDDLLSRVAIVEQDLAPTLRAEAVASRNGWLQALVVAAALLLVAGCVRRDRRRQAPAIAFGGAGR